MLRASGIRKSFGACEVLEGADWGITPGSRWGFVGPNGAGKTTLIRILTGAEEPDAGRVDRPREATIAHLPQEGAHDSAGSRTEASLLESVLAPFTEIASMEAEITRLQHLLAEGEGMQDDVARRLGDTQHRFEVAGGFTLEAEAKIILTGLGFAPKDHGRSLAEFSGGYRMRALLGSLLLRRPDYLLMDEPTNHLDLDGVAWLESYLARLPSAVVVVSHDRFFLNRVVNSIAELDHGRIRVFRGGYDDFRVEKEAQRERAANASSREKKREAEVRRFIDRFRYKATKARQVQERIKMLEKTERTSVPDDDVLWGFRFPHISLAPRFVLTLAEVEKSFGPLRVLDGASLIVERGDRVALIGPNGCGKSTLLRIAAGLLAFDGGDVRRGEGVAIRYFAQHVLETLTPGRTVLEELQEIAPTRRVGDLRSLLGIFQFSGDDAFKRVESISGGEKSRLALARLTLDPGHLLVLDEPTNHLDFAAREALEEALNEYEGTVVFVSHDRYFINRVASRVAGFEAGKLRVVEGDFDAYAAAVAGQEAAPPDRGLETNSPASEAGSARREDRRATAESRNERNKIVRALGRAVARLEEEISRREARLGEINVSLADPATYRSEGKAEALGREQKTLQNELSDLFVRWEAGSAELTDARSDP